MSSLIAFRFGAPLLLLFLGIGLLAGVDGLGINFTNNHAAYWLGSLALAVILFDSGFGTPLRAFRIAAIPAISLATFGVLITAGLFALGAMALLASPFSRVCCSARSSPPRMRRRCSSCSGSAG